MPRLIMVVYLLLLAYGMAFTFSPTLESGFQRLQTDPGDTVLNHYFLEHSWRCLAQPDYRGTLWSPAFLYPTPNVLAYSDNLFGGAPLYWLFRLFSSDVLAYQLWMMASFVLSFSAMAIVLRWFGIRHSLSALGAFLFAFHLPCVQQLGHQQLCPRWWIPFAIWYTWRFLQEPTGRSLFGVLFCITAQFITGVYVGWFLGFGLGLLGVVAMAIHRDTRTRLISFVIHSPFSVAVAVLVNGLMAATVAVPYLRVNQGFHRLFGEVLNGMPRWNSWFSVPPGTLWSSILEPITLGQGGEGYICGGLASLILLMAAVAGSRSRQSGFERVWLSTILDTVLLMAILTLSIWIDDFHGGSLWFLIYQIVPGAGAIRVVFRIYLILYPLLIIAGLLGLQRTMAEASVSIVRQGVLIALLTGVALAENYFPQRNDGGRSFRHALVYDEARRIGKDIRGMDAVYGYSFAGGSSCHVELKMMWAGLYANVPVINGYSGRMPPKYPFDGSKPSIETVREWLGKDWHGRVTIYDLNEGRKEETVELNP